MSRTTSGNRHVHASDRLDVGRRAAGTRLWCGLLVGLIAAGGMGVVVDGQEVPAETRAEAPDLEGSLSRSISFAPDREMETRLRGATTAFATGNSVDGVRVLAELLALPEPHQIQVESTFRDVREEAARILRASSDEVRDQFQRETEVRAAAELQAAVTSGDYGAVARIAACYPGTPTARECAEVLATQFSDHGRFDAVVQTAQRWVEQSPVPAQAAKSHPRLIEMWSLALRELGATDAANRLAGGDFAPEVLHPFRASSSEMRAPSAMVAADGSAVAWDVASELPPQARVLLRKTLNDLARQGIHPALAMRPLVLKDRVLWRSLTELVCIDRSSGTVHWRKAIPDPTIDSIAKLDDRPDPNLERRLRMQLGHRVLRNSIFGQLTSDAERVYCVEYYPAKFIPPNPEPPANNAPAPNYTPVPNLSVAAYSLADGSLQWQSLEVWQGKYRDALVCGPPSRQGKSVYTVVQLGDQLVLMEREAATGVLGGVSVLGDAPPLDKDQRRMSQACPVVWHDGLAICATGAGGVAAFDLFAGQLRWGFRHPRDDIEIAPKLLQPPVDKNGWTWMEGWETPQLVKFGTRLVHASPETNMLRCLDADDGTLLWEVPIAGTRQIVGGDGERVVISGTGVVRSLRLDDGHMEQEYLPSATIISAGWAGGVCQLGLGDHRRVTWNPSTGVTAIIQERRAGGPLLASVGSLRPVQSPLDTPLLRSELVGRSELINRIDSISMRFLNEGADPGDRAPRLPVELAWNSGNPQDWLRSMTEWIGGAAVEERAARVELALSELAWALDSEAGRNLPIEEWVTRWTLTPDQDRELAFRRLQRALADNESLSAVTHLLRLLELKPQLWEVERSSARWGHSPGGDMGEALRTVRLDAALRGALQELWENAAPAERTGILAAYSAWAARPDVQLDDLAHPLEPLSFLPAPMQERPFEWKTLGELAVQQLDLRRRSASHEGPTAAAALWRLAELHMARGDWGDAARYIELLQRKFGAVAVRGGQTTRELVDKFPPESLILKRIDSDRRTAWPDREPVVTSKPTFGGPDQRVIIPIRAERGSLLDRLNVTISLPDASEIEFSGLNEKKPWKFSLDASSRYLKNACPELRSGWAFGQFLVLQNGSELFCLSSLDRNGEGKASRKREMILWPPRPDNRVRPVMVDTLGDEDNALLSGEVRGVRQYAGFVRIFSEMFNAHGHRMTWVGPVNAGTLCFLQQGMLVCLETATGRELWRRYDVPPGVRTFGDDGVIVLAHDGDNTIDLLSPLDGRKLRSYQSPHRSEDWIKNWGRNVLVASGQPALGMKFGPPDPAASAPELQLQMVDLAGPHTLWQRTFPAGSAAFEVDEEWLGVLSSDGTLSFLDLQTGQSAHDSRVEIPSGINQIATAVTERSIYVTLSPRVTEERLTKAPTLPLGPRRFFVNGPIHAFDRLSGVHQWSQRIENRGFSIDQPRDVPLLICADLWDNSAPEKKQVARPSADVVSRFWCLDARTGKVVLDVDPKPVRPLPAYSAQSNAYSLQRNLAYSVQRHLDRGLVELHLNDTKHSFNYAPETSEAK